MPLFSRWWRAQMYGWRVNFGCCKVSQIYGRPQYRIQWLCRVPVTLSKSLFDLGKNHSAKLLTAKALGKAAANCRRMWQLCRVLDSRHSAKCQGFAECRWLALGKVFFLLTCEGHFAECFWLMHSAK